MNLHRGPPGLERHWMVNPECFIFGWVNTSKQIYCISHLLTGISTWTCEISNVMLVFRSMWILLVQEWYLGAKQFIYHTLPPFWIIWVHLVDFLLQSPSLYQNPTQIINHPTEFDEQLLYYNTPSQTFFSLEAWSCCCSSIFTPPRLLPVNCGPASSKPHLHDLQDSGSEVEHRLAWTLRGEVLLIRNAKRSIKTISRVGGDGGGPSMVREDHETYSEQFFHCHPSKIFKNWMGPYQRTPKEVTYPKNHGISKLVVWRSQTPAIHIQTPL